MYVFVEAFIVYLVHAACTASCHHETRKVTQHSPVTAKTVYQHSAKKRFYYTVLYVGVVTVLVVISVCVKREKQNGR